MPPVRIGDDGKPTGLFKDENGMTVYADCHGLNREVYAKRDKKRNLWGELQEVDLPDDQSQEDSYDEEEQ